MVNRDQARFRSGHDRSDTIMLFEGVRSCRLTKYSFPRRSMPAARFRQWHFNRRARNSCLHLHRVLFPLPPFFARLFVVIPTQCSSRLCSTNLHVAPQTRIACRARCGCRCAWNCSHINTHSTAGIHVFPHTYGAPV